MTSEITLTLNLTAKTGRITDTTDYSDLGFNLANANAKGLGTILFNGEIIDEKTSVGNPLINLASGATYYDFPLVTDTTGAVANGVYQIVYSVRMAPTNLQFLSSGTTDILVGDGNPEYAQFLLAGDELTLDGTVDLDVEILTVDDLVSGNPQYTLTEEVDFTSYDAYTFDITHETFNDSFTYSGCDLTTANVAFTFDCEYGDNGSWNVSNSTELNGATLSSLSGTVSYPGWTGETPISVTALPYSNNRLATGTYSANITMIFTQTQTDGLILQYSSNVIKEGTATCVGSLCALTSCIELLRQKNAEQWQNNKISSLQGTVDNVLLYFKLADIYKACGELSNYNEAIAAIQEELEGADCCNCGCDDPEAGQFFWVYNTSQEAQDQIEEIQAELVEIGYNLPIYEAPVIVINDPSDYPSAVDLYIPFSEVSEITIPKGFFEAAPNGFSGKGVTIEVTTYTNDGSSLYITNAADDSRIYSAVSSTAQQNVTRHEIKLSTVMASGTVFCMSSGESWETGIVASDAVEKYYHQEIDEDLWDLTEDLVIAFNMSADNDDCAITRIRIQGYNIQ